MFALLSLIVSLIAMKLSPKKGWAIAGAVIGGIQTLYIIVCLICVMLFAK